MLRCTRQTLGCQRYNTLAAFLLLALKGLNDLPKIVAMLFGDPIPDCAYFIDNQIASHG